MLILKIYLVFQLFTTQAFKAILFPCTPQSIQIWDPWSCYSLVQHLKQSQQRINLSRFCVLSSSLWRTLSPGSSSPFLHTKMCVCMAVSSPGRDWVWSLGTELELSPSQSCSWPHTGPKKRWTEPTPVGSTASLRPPLPQSASQDSCQLVLRIWSNPRPDWFGSSLCCLRYEVHHLKALEIETPPAMRVYSLAVRVCIIYKCKPTHLAVFNTPTSRVGASQEGRLTAY